MRRHNCTALTKLSAPDEDRNACEHTPYLHAPCKPICDLVIPIRLRPL